MFNSDQNHLSSLPQGVQPIEEENDNVVNKVVVLEHIVPAFPGT